MKKLLLFAILLLLCSCNYVSMQKDEARNYAKKSGIRIDSIFIGIRFNDSPETVQEKLNEWASHNYLGKFEFHFTHPKRLNQYKWKRSGCYFYNDSLYSFSLRAEVPSYKWDECFEDLDSLYSYKYGKPIRDIDGHELDWYKGNLNITISGMKSKYSESVWISYTNYDFYDRRMDRYKSFMPNENKYDFDLTYGKLYWDKIYQKTNNILIEDAAKNI